MRRHHETQSFPNCTSVTYNPDYVKYFPCMCVKFVKNPENHGGRNLCILIVTHVTIVSLCVCLLTEITVIIRRSLSLTEDHRY